MRSTATSILVLMSLLFPVFLEAGPNAGGVILLHYNPNAIYCLEKSHPYGICGQGGLRDCEEALVRAARGGTWIPGAIFAYAAFPATSAPRLSALSFGLAYDPSVDYGSLGFGVDGHRACPGVVPTGACCSVAGECQVLTHTQCDEQHGVHSGDGTDCDPKPMSAADTDQEDVLGADQAPLPRTPMTSTHVREA